MLYYYKDYPTFDVLGAKFDRARSKAHANAQALSPLLHETLVQLERYNILVDRFRNHREHFQDDVIAICAGLWNLSLAY